MRIAEFQKLIRDRYHASDSARGVPGTFCGWLKEIGELASALADAERVKKDENLAEEFADVFAWLTTIANIHDVDLEAAIRDKYIQDGGPEERSERARPPPNHPDIRRAPASKHQSTDAFCGRRTPDP